jgi:hypothetical protein
MSRWSRSLIGSALASAFVVALIPGAQAYQTPKHRHHVAAHPVVHHPGDIYVRKTVPSYLDPGPSADYQSDLYYEDTSYPRYLLGPGIFQRQLTSPGQYN